MLSPDRAAWSGDAPHAPDARSDADPRAVPLAADAALPGAAVLLAPGALEAWLADQLGREGAVTMRRLRYKPGTSLVLGFVLTTVDGGELTRPCVAWAYGPGGEEKLRKHLAVTPSWSHLAVDHRRRLLVTTLAGDRALPGLRRLEQLGGLPGLVARTVPDHPRLAEGRVTTLRHNPERRWVALVETADGARAVVRGYASAAAMGHARTSHRLLARRGAPVLAPLGGSRSLATLAVPYAEGTELHSRTDPESWAAAGSALARLHGTRAHGLPRWRADGGAGRVARTAAQVATLLPDLAGRVTAVAGEICRRLPGLPDDAAVVHGDFSPDQVVLGPGGPGGPGAEVTLVDLDAAGIGSAAVDLGCLAASAGPEPGADAAAGEARVQALLEGYERLRPLPDRAALGVHEAAVLVRKAADPFRECDPDWASKVRRRVWAAERALQRAGVVGVGG